MMPSGLGVTNILFDFWQCRKQKTILYTDRHPLEIYTGLAYSGSPGKECIKNNSHQI